MLSRAPTSLCFATYAAHAQGSGFAVEDLADLSCMQNAIAIEGRSDAPGGGFQRFTVLAKCSAEKEAWLRGFRSLSGCEVRSKRAASV